MKRILIDHLPLNNNPLFSNDYNSMLIYSAIMLPLFKYDKNKRLKSFACDKYTIHNYKKFNFKIRKDIYYSNGIKVTDKDYYESLLSIKNNTCFGKFLLNNVKKIYLDNGINIELYHKDTNFLHKLTYYSFSAYDNGLTCGPYYIDKTTNNEIILKKNKYYKFNDININELSFKLSDNNDINDFDNNKASITSITTYPLNKINSRVLKYKSNLIMCIKCGSNKTINNRKIRNIIFSSIDSSKINDILYGAHIPKDNFLLNSNSFSLFKKINNKEKIELTFGYTDYYPNKIVAEEIKKQLSKNNINVKLKKYKLCDANNYDIYLDIEVCPFNYDEYFYYSPYFYIVHSNFYKFMIKYFSNINLLEKRVKKECKVFPIINLNYIYLCDSELTKLDFNIMNYYDL